LIKDYEVIFYNDVHRKTFIAAKYYCNIPLKKKIELPIFMVTEIGVDCLVVA